MTSYMLYFFFEFEYMVNRLVINLDDILWVCVFEYDKVNMIKCLKYKWNGCEIIYQFSHICVAAEISNLNLIKKFVFV